MLLLLLPSRFKSCPTLCDPIDGGTPVSTILGILQARILGCNFLLQCMKVKAKLKSVNRVQLLGTPWTAAYQASLSMGLSRQEYWSGLPLPSLNILARDSQTLVNRKITRRVKVFIQFPGIVPFSSGWGLEIEFFNNYSADSYFGYSMDQTLGNTLPEWPSLQSIA